MKNLPLGKTDIEVSSICLGCWAFANDKMWGAQDDQNSIATIHAALDAGINFLDTAEAYGDGYSEQVIGEAIKDRRDKVVIATKVKPSNLAPQDLITACENSLHRLQTDYIDLYQIHWASREIPLEDTLGALLKLKEQGKIRSIGVSNFGTQDLDTAQAITRIDANQLSYSLLTRAIEYELLPECDKQSVSVLCYSPLMHGLLTGKFASADEFPPERARTRHFSSGREQTRHHEDGCEQETFAAIGKIREIAQANDYTMVELAVAWLLHQQGVTSVITGARSPEQVSQIAKAGEIQLTDDIVQALSAATEPVKTALGTNIDMWRTESRIR